MKTHTYSVPDVTCEHCVRAITGEVTGVDGVRSVDVDLAAKRVTVVADDRVTEARIRAAIEEAGYDIPA